VERLELIKKALDANGVKMDPVTTEASIREWEKEGKGIWLDLPKGFCFAYVEGPDLMVWQMYNEGGTLASHKDVLGKLKGFAINKGATKMILSINGSRYLSAMRLYRDMRPRVRMVQLEVDL
jgi:hypothetical protein